MNQTIQESVVSTLQHYRLSEGFWAQFLLTAVHIVNKSSSRPLGLKIPQEIWTGSKPNYDKLRIFSCKEYALIPKDDRQKLEPRSRKSVSLDMDPTARLDIDSWTSSTDKSSEVRMSCSTSRLCTKRPKGNIFRSANPSSRPNSQHEIGFTCNRHL